MLEERPIATTGRNSSRAACSGSRARVPSERTHTRPYSVSSPPTRRRIRSLPALLDEGATKDSAFDSRTSSISSRRSSAAWAEAKVWPPVAASSPTGSSSPGPGALIDCWLMGGSLSRSVVGDGAPEAVEDGGDIGCEVDAVLFAPGRRSQHGIRQAQAVTALLGGHGQHVPAGRGHRVAVMGDQLPAQVGAGGGGRGGDRGADLGLIDQRTHGSRGTQLLEQPAAGPQIGDRKS